MPSPRVTFRKEESSRAPHSKLVKCQFLSYFRARTGKPALGELWLDVSSGAEPPWDRFSPFFPHGGIPVPGLPGVTSDSVEGIWQGLKVIRGKIATRYFEGAGRKRGGKPAGHQLGEQKRLLGIEEARRRIYIPAYEWMLENRIEPQLIEEIIGRAFRGEPQFFYDREDNASIGKDQPLAHAAVLVRYLNRTIDERM